jgi:hypothetical protein
MVHQVEKGNGRQHREGFVPPDAPMPARENTQSNPPMAPLASQMKTEAPVPEPPNDEYAELRKEIGERNESWPVTVQLLYRPIKNDRGEEISSLTFREPRASEINRIGNPTRMLWDGEIIIEERKMTYIMAALCGILPPLLEAMDPRDWNSCAYRLRKFFLPDLRAW